LIQPVAPFDFFKLREAKHSGQRYQEHDSAVRT
jgi:hypothetical protein